MAAHDFSRPDPIADQFIGDPGPCFLCGATIHGIGVFWHGHPQKLFFHEACAREFGCHLISDAIDAKKMRAKLWRPVPRLVQEAGE